MKTYFELNKNQQHEAVQTFFTKFKHKSMDNVLDYSNCKRPTEKKMWEYAQAAAEMALYAEQDEHVLYDIADKQFGNG